MSIKWKEQKKDLEFFPLEKLYSKISFCESIPIMLKEIQVWFENKCQREINSHLLSSKKELGGLLIGSVYSNNDNNFNYGLIHIKESVESTEFSSSGVSLTMSPDVWNSANKISDNKNYVIGWYHSHPNLGAFFSGTDKYTQKNFFPNTYNLGLVIDPFNNEQKIYISKDSREIQKENISIVQNGVA